jgi:hypothetical protein
MDADTVVAAGTVWKMTVTTTDDHKKYRQGDPDSTLLASLPDMQVHPIPGSRGAA